MQQLSRAWWLVLALTSLAWAPATSAAPANAGGGNSPPGQANGRPPNILFIIMDDVGIDQMSVFGYGGTDAAATPNIDAIAHAGVRFRNVWAMPECSPSRAVFFEGRYPLRTNVMSALLSDDLANSQVSPFEVTTPQVLRKRRYESANFGKFHIATSTNNPYGMGIVAALGWDYFDGFLDGAPHPIDKTAGGVAQFQNPAGVSYSCGFVPNFSADPNRPGGADTGACRFADNTCQVMSTPDQRTPGYSCMEQGGIFWPNLTCSDTTPGQSAFGNQNAYYAWERVINFADGRVEDFKPDDPSMGTRRFIGEVLTDSAVSWINTEKKGNKKWMVTAAYPQIHAPYQQVPPALLPPGSDPQTDLDCTPNIPKGEGIANYHLLSNQLLESMDAEIGRLLVQTGLASYNADGSLNYQPENTDTMVILLGDNGTYGPGVKDPFDPTRAKGYVYQTGVWVPLIVAGPMVSSPNREVRSMVNIADLFQLFGEIAGVDVRQVVPSSHILDSQPMLAYLTNPNQAGIRQTNFTQTGPNIHVGTPPPCIVVTTGVNACVQLFPSADICHLEGGKWFGPNPDEGTVVFQNCCALQNQAPPDVSPVSIVPEVQSAIRNDAYKLVQFTTPNCKAPPGSDGNYPSATTTEFYLIDEAPGAPRLDKSQNPAPLCADTTISSGVMHNCPGMLNQQQAAVYNSLLVSLNGQNGQGGILNSEPACPGDGNLDKLVDQKDVQAWKSFYDLTSPPGMISSWYDFNHDGVTDKTDLGTIQTYLGTHCLPKK